MGGLGLYFYAMLVNSVKRGRESTFSITDNSVKPLFEWNPFINFLALFSPTGIGVTFILVLMMLIYADTVICLYFVLEPAKCSKIQKIFNNNI